MKNMKLRFGFAIVTFCVLAHSSIGQDRERFITLTIELNGAVVRSPTEVLVTYDGQSSRVPVREGRFRAPNGTLGAKNVGIEFLLQGRKVHPSGISGVKVQAEQWKLVLADHRYRGNSREFQRYVVGGVKAKHTCVVVFSGAETESTFLFDQECRK